MPVGRGKKKSKAPVFSQQFFLDNHADIFSCICMVVCVGLMFQVTSSISQAFVAPQYNVTINVTQEGSDETKEIVKYYAGTKDCLTVIFYIMIWIIVHAVCHEYIWEKYSRRLHLSKTKTSEFYDSGNFVLYYLASTVGGVVILYQRGYAFPPSRLWREYPDLPISFAEKMYFIIVMAFWCHNIPELYLMKTKKEETKDKITLSAIHFGLSLSYYAFGFIRLGIFFIVLHNLVEFLAMLSAILVLIGKSQPAIRKLWSVTLVISKISTMAIAVAAFLFGLPNQTNSDIPAEFGNFNLPTIRFPVFVGTMAIILFETWDFIKVQLKTYKEKKERRKAVSQQRQEQKERKDKKKEDDLKKRKQVGTKSGSQDESTE
eukprot:m.307626 g.307626  ORF g.307626 m.307626 type:complete len:374 (+) comp42547_c0_seq1:64-1185(+)